MRLLVCIGVTIFNLSISNAQLLDTLSIGDKIYFLDHLKNNNQIEDAIVLANHFNKVCPHDSLKLIEIKYNLWNGRFLIADSLLKTYFLNGIEYKINKCILTLLQNHCELLKGNFDQLKNPSCKNHNEHRETWKIQLLISCLNQKKLEEFNMLFDNQKCQNPVLSLIEFDLYVQMMDIKKNKVKNPLLAGMLSALIPGLGKVYAKKPHEALTSLMPVAFNWIQAAEGYYYEQWRSPHFYIFGSIGTVFYFSNIAGSSLSAKRKNKEFNTYIKNNIDFETNKLISFY